MVLHFKLLHEIASTSSGGTPSRAVEKYWNGDIPWIKSGQLKDDYITECDEFITEDGLKNSSANIVSPNTLLLALYGATAGKLAFTTFEATTNQAVCAIVTNDTLVNKKYLFYFLLSIRPKILNDASGGAQPNISQSYVKNIKVPLPPLHIQEQIADTLDKADALRKKDQELLKKYDELAQSMYFNFIENVSFKYLTFEEVSMSPEGIRCGPFGTQLQVSDFSHKGVPLWGIKHVNSNFKTYTTEYLSEEKARQLDVYSIESGDLVMTRKGTIGKVCVYPDTLVPGVMHSDLLRIRLDSNIASGVFFQYQLRHDPEIKSEVSKISQGAIMAGINVSKLKKLKVKVPSINSQLDFSRYINHVEQIKLVTQNATDKSKYLFNSIVNIYNK